MRPEPELDSTIAAEIDRIKGIDNHGHPLELSADNEKPDDEFDALTLRRPRTILAPLRLRPDNPEYVAAWRTLYGYSHQDMSDAHVKQLVDLKIGVMGERGDGYPDGTRLGIEVMLANRVAMGRGLTAPRFRWVSMVDPLIFPLSNEAARRKNSDYRSFFVGEDRLLKRYLAESGLSIIPRRLEDYVSEVVTRTLERHQSEGAVAVKFEAGYFRSLDFAAADEAQARATYARYVTGGEPPDDEYKNLQDLLFHFVAREAGRLELAVHIHDCYGVGSYYSMRDSHPSLLETALNDPALRKTNFVIVHGGWPFSREVGPLLLKPNVYADTSAMTFILYPRAMAAVLREWLELMAEKYCLAPTRGRLLHR